MKNFTEIIPLVQAVTIFVLLHQIFAEIKKDSARKSTDLVEKLISHVLPQCYIIQIRNHGVNSHQTSLLSQQQIPVVDVNLKELGYSNTTNLFNELGIKQIIRHQLQCVTFYVTFDDTVPLPEINRISKLFAEPALQAQAHTSYIIMHQVPYSESVNTLILSPELKNFPSRVWVNFNSDTQALEVHHFCYYCFGGKPGLRPVDTISGISERKNIFPDVTRNLDGHTLRCTAPPAPPLVAILPSGSNPAELTIVGMQAIILNSLASTLNFTYSLRKASGGLTGARLANGSWTGIMGEILENKADIGLSVATSYERNQLFHFTVPVFNAFLVMVSTKTTPFFDWEAIFHPFKITAWFAILASTILSILGYRWLHNYSLQLVSPNKVAANRTKGRVSMFKSTYLMVGALLEQGVPLNFTLLPSRLYVGIWFLFSIVVTCAYRSKLFLFLTFPIIEKPPSTLHELSGSQYKWGLKSLGGIGLLFITQSPLSYVRYIGEHLEISTDKYSCLDKTVTEKFVCIIYKAYIDYMAELRYWKIKHKFFISDYLTSPVGSSWVLPKHSPLLAILDRFHISQFEMGLANKYVEDYQQAVAKQFRNLAQVSNSTADTFELNTNYVREIDGAKPLQIGNLYGVFFILFFGVSVAFLYLIFEIVRKQRIVPIINIRRPIGQFQKRVERVRIGVAFGLMPRKRKSIPHREVRSTQWFQSGRTNGNPDPNLRSTD